MWNKTGCILVKLQPKCGFDAACFRWWRELAFVSRMSAGGTEIISSWMCWWRDLVHVLGYLYIAKDKCLWIWSGGT